MPLLAALAVAFLFFGVPALHAGAPVAARTVDAGYLLDDHAALSSTVPFTETRPRRLRSEQDRPGGRPAVGRRHRRRRRSGNTLARTRCPPIAASASCLRPRRRAPSPNDVLRAAMQAPSHVSYVGEMQTMRIGDQHGEVAIYRVEHRAPDMTRRWYLAPEALYGDSTISRGSVSFAVDVKRNRVVVSENGALDDQDALAGNFDLLTKNYRAVFGPDEPSTGVPCA